MGETEGDKVVVAGERGLRTIVGGHPDLQVHGRGEVFLNPVHTGKPNRKEGLELIAETAQIICTYGLINLSIY